MSVILQDYFENVRLSLEKAERDDKKNRIVAIDVLKGIAICLVIMAHLSSWVLTPEWKWAYFLMYMILDVFGPSLFVFLSCLGVVFSAKKKSDHYNEKEIRNKILRRAFALLIVAFITNIPIGFDLTGPLAFWLWGVLQFIAFAQIITYYALKLPKHSRMLIAFLIVYITPLFFQRLTDLMSQNGIDFAYLEISDLRNIYAFIYWLFFFPASQVPILPWIVIPLVGSIVGENLVSAFNIHNSKNKQIYRKFNRNLFFDGLFMAIVGVLSGLELQSDDFGLNILEGINTSPYFNWSGIPEFLIHSSVPNIMYSLGIGFILLSISFHICEILGHKGKLVQFFTFFGRFSLSLFALHPIFFIGTRDSMDPIMFFIFIAAVIAGLGILIYIWRYRWKAIGTLEWIIIAVGGLKSKHHEHQPKQLLNLDHE